MESIEKKTAVNTAIAAAAVEQVIDGTDRVEYYDSLTVVNLDITDITVRLDGDTTKVYPVAKRSSTSINRATGDKIAFKRVQQINNDAASAQTAGLITFIAERLDHA